MNLFASAGVMEFDSSNKPGVRTGVVALGVGDGELVWLLPDEIPCGEEEAATAVAAANLDADTLENVNLVCDASPAAAAVTVGDFTVAAAVEEVALDIGDVDFDPGAAGKRI